MSKPSIPLNDEIPRKLAMELDKDTTEDFRTAVNRFKTFKTKFDPVRDSLCKEDNFELRSTRLGDGSSQLYHIHHLVPTNLHSRRGR